METNKTFADELSAWSKNGLSQLYGKDILKEPEVIAGIGHLGSMSKGLLELMNAQQ